MTDVRPLEIDVVDDDSFVRKSVIEVVNLIVPKHLDRQVTIHGSANGEIARARIASEYHASGQLPDVVITDNNMPERDGLSLIEELLKLEHLRRESLQAHTAEFREMLLILMTARADEVNSHPLIVNPDIPQQGGRIHLVAKPFNIADIKNILVAHFGNKQ